MDPHLILPAIAPVVALLALGISTVVITRRLGQSPIIGYLLLGALLHAAGVDPGASHIVEVLAELGLVFLIFDTGLHFSLDHVRDQLSSIFGLGPMQMLIGTTLLGVGGLLLGLSLLPAFLIGATLSLSSTAAVERIIADRNQQNCPVGLTATAILLYHDLAAIFILVVADTTNSKAELLPEAMLALAKAATAFGVAVLLSRLIVLPAFGLLARSRNEEVFPATALLVALAAGWATGMVGLPLSLGAFLGGMVIAETPYRPLIRSEIRPFRGLLLGFFFVFVGATLDVSMVLAAWPTVIGITAAIIVLKVIANAAASFLFRWSMPGSAQLGFLLAQGSEVSFVILSLPAVRTLVGERPCALLIASVTLSLAATPNLAELGRSIAARLRRRHPGRSAGDFEDAPVAPVVIAGMSRRGRAVADALASIPISYSAIESDPQRFGDAIADGYAVEFGDIADARLWQSFAMTGRQMLVLTEPTYEVSRELTPLAQEFFPSVSRIVAVDSAADADRFTNIGLTPVTDADKTGTALAAEVLSRLLVDKAALEGWHKKQMKRAAHLGRGAGPGEPGVPMQVPRAGNA